MVARKILYMVSSRKRKFVTAIVFVNVGFILWLCSSFFSKWSIETNPITNKSRHRSASEFQRANTLSFHNAIKTINTRFEVPDVLNPVAEILGFKIGQRTSSKMCPDILDGMARGRWIKRHLTSVEEARVDSYLKAERGAYHIPSNFQRADGRCGDVAYESSPLYKHMWFKAICDPKGSTPCCKDNKCVSLSVDQCKCAGCADERAAIHAEFAKWQPENSACEVHNYSTSEACKLLEGSTISFVGDSFIRHLFASMVILLTGNPIDGALKKDLSQYERQTCSGWHQVTGLICRALLVEKKSLCGGTVQIDYTEVFPARQLPLSMPVVQSHLSKNRKSLIVLGLGIHNDFIFDDVANIFLKPFLNIHQYWRHRLKDIASVVAAIKSFKNNVTDDDNITINKLKNIYLNHPSKKNTISPGSKNFTSFDSLYSQKVKISYSLLDIEKMEKDLNLNQNIGENNDQIFLHPSNQSTSNLLHHHPNLTLSNSSPDISHSKLYLQNNRKSSNLLWIGTHAPGVLKSPIFTRQTHAGVLSYNRDISKLLEQWKVPYLDTFNFTDGAVSFDGTHYGWGINMLKINMILNYIEKNLKPKNWDS